MTTKDEGVRKQAIQKFQDILNEAAAFFAEILGSSEDIPVLSITQQEYDSGIWRAPPSYKDIFHQVTGRILADRYYRLSPAQMRLALLQGAEAAGKLFIDGVLVIKSQPIRRTALFSHRGGIRRRTSLRAT